MNTLLGSTVNTLLDGFNADEVGLHPGPLPHRQPFAAVAAVPPAHDPVVAKRKERAARDGGQVKFPIRHHRAG